MGRRSQRHVGGRRAHRAGFHAAAGRVARLRRRFGAAETVHEWPKDVHEWELMYTNCGMVYTDAAIRGVSPRSADDDEKMYTDCTRIVHESNRKAGKNKEKQGTRLKSKNPWKFKALRAFPRVKEWSD